LIPVLTFFIDALKPESLEYMPFVNSFVTKRRVKSELGYSNTCHATMYSGVHPDKHNVWFTWKYSPNTSPFRWINTLKLHKLPHNTYIKYAYYRLAKIFDGRYITAFFNIPFLWSIPLKEWHNFDVTELKYWTDRSYLEKYTTIFQLLRDNKIDFDVVGMPIQYAGPYLKKHPLNSLMKFTPRKIKPWTFMWLGELDDISHLYGQDSERAHQFLGVVDKIIEKKYRYFQSKVGDFAFFLYSDHGHTKVTRLVDIDKIFKDAGRNIDDYTHMIDSNYARFWLRSDKEKSEVEDVLSGMTSNGFILTEDLARKYNIEMPDNRFGDLIFCLNASLIFDKGEIYALGKRRNPSWVSMHAYLPDYPDSDGVFVSNRQLQESEFFKLVDVMPTILDPLGVKAPPGIDGQSRLK
jgi:predicted AlkP superfamily pyrophosphatase or phosphodiesterase